VLLIAALTLPVAAVGQQPGPVKVTDQGVLVDFQDADLRLVLSALAEAARINLVYSELPARKVTLRMKQPVSQEELPALLKSLAQSNGLTVTEDGGFLRLEGAGISTTGTAAKRPPDPGSELRLFVYRLRHARSARLAGTLQSVFGRVKPPELSAREQPLPLSQALPQQGLTPSEPGPPGGEPQPAVTAEMGAVRANLPGQLKGEIQIVADETTNSLLVRAAAADWDVVRQAIDALDLRPLQALIEVVIAEVRRTSESELSLSGKVADSKMKPTVRGTLNGTTTGDFVLEALRAGTLDLTLALSALSSRGSVRILSRPVLLAQNNQEAKILIGSERPFVQVSRSLPTDAAVRDQVIQYRDVGTKLTITPTINDDGYVNLQVLQEVSTATAETQFGAPVISTREASTYLFIKDGHMAVLGGLIDRQQERSKSGIPLLKEIPLIGGLFGTTRKSTSNSELFLFLTPHIIATDEDADRVREDIESETTMLKDTLPGRERSKP
jgi:general secretion pathway protein D